VKQTLFAILEPQLRGRPFLDLFAGSGAAGIEALSRGASGAVFVESDAEAIAAIEQNLAATGLAGPQATVVHQSATAWVIAAARTGAMPYGPASVAFIDPPYRDPVYLDWALEGIADEGKEGVLASDGVIVAKHFWKTPPLPVPLLRSVRQERFGETMLTFYRWAEEEDG
jgi:16S rRNA (guanine(966)-N(2))-methyltransferase RsmD